MSAKPGLTADDLEAVKEVISGMHYQVSGLYGFRGTLTVRRWHADGNDHDDIHVNAEWAAGDEPRITALTTPAPGAPEEET